MQCRRWRRDLFHVSGTDVGWTSTRIGECLERRFGLARSCRAIAGYREELSRQRSRVLRSVPIAVAGGLVGALLLLGTDDKLFRSLVPWLLLFATLIFAFSGQLRTFERLAGQQVERGRAPTPAALLCEFGIAVYGGYFGAGLGVLMFAALSLLGVDDMQEANALKNVLATIVSTIAIAVFLVGGAVAFQETSIVLAGAVAGGYFGARAARRLPIKWLRKLVIAVGLILTLYYWL
jgi:uncharacterized membrane protein YfcA